MVYLASAFFSVDIAPESQEQFAFTWEGCQWTSIVFPQGYLHNSTISHGLVTQDLATWGKPSTVTMFHYIEDMMLNYPLILLQI